MKFSKVIRIEDNNTFYQIVTYIADQPVECDLSLGEIKILFDDRLYKTVEGPEDFKKTLFPQKRVNPLHIDDITKDTLVVLTIRQNHFLYNTTLSTNDCMKELMYTSDDRLRYLFFGFTEKNVMIRPRIFQDDKGLLKYFKDNLGDNHIRQTILDFMSLPKPLTDTLEDLMLERADYSIIYKGDKFDIKFNGKDYLSLNNDQSAKDIIYIIKNKINLNSSELWDRLRAKKSADALMSLNKNYQRLKNRIKEIENELNIASEDKFSEFLDLYVKIDSAKDLIIYRAPSSIDWKFKLPKEFDS